MSDEYPVPFRHAALALDSVGVPLWEQGALDEEFQFASVTKLLTALGVHLAAQDGLLRLDQPAGPEGSTVAHLLAHASGLGPRGDGTRTAARVGMRRIYSDQGYELLGRIVEEATGDPQWVKHRLLEPLGAGGISTEGSPAWGAKGTARALSLVLFELLSPSILDPETVDAFRSPAFPGLRGVLPGYGTQEKNLWGLGPEISSGKSPHWTGPDTSPETFGHFGVSGSFLWVDPETERGALFLGEEPFGDWHKENWGKLSSELALADPAR